MLVSHLIELSCVNKYYSYTGWCFDKISICAFIYCWDCPDQMIGKGFAISVSKLRVVLERFLFSYLCKFCRNAQPSFMSRFRNILVFTGQPRHGQRTVSKPADSGGFRTLLLLAEQPEGVLPCWAVPDRPAGGQLQLSSLLHCWSFKILPQRNSLTDGQHTALVVMFLGAAAWLFGFCS